MVASLAPGASVLGDGSGHRDFVAVIQDLQVQITELKGQASALLQQRDLNRTEHIKRIWPYFRDRRIDAYDDLTKRWRDE